MQINVPMQILNAKETELFWKKTMDVSYNDKIKKMPCFKASKHLPTPLLVGKAAWGCQKSKRPQEYCQSFTVFHFQKLLSHHFAIKAKNSATKTPVLHSCSCW
jgi:hypothetical protein